MTVIAKEQIKGDVKVVHDALLDAENLVAMGFGDVVDFETERVAVLANVSESTRKRDTEIIKYVVEQFGLSFSPQSKETKKTGSPRKRFRYWSRDAVVIYRAYRSVMDRFRCPSDYERNRDKWLPLIAKYYAHSR